MASNSNILAVYIKALKSELEGELETASSLLENCLEIDNSFVTAEYKKATIMLKQEKWEEAECLLRKLIKGKNKEVHLLNNLSISLLRQNKLDEALSYAALSLENADKSEKASAYVNVGTILHEKNNIIDAEFHYLKALELSPNNKNAILNLGVIQLERRNLAEAENYFQLALDKDPLDTTASTNLAGTLLIQNKAREGWYYYEKRLSTPGGKIDIPNGLKQWDGKEKINKIILVHEQGLGDTFQFIRYAENLKRLNIRCYFYGPKKLHGI